MTEDMQAAWLEIEQMLGEATREEFDVFLRTWQRAVQATRKTLAQPDFWEGYVPEPVKPAQQEPVAYLCENAVGHKYFRWKKPSSTYKPIALYTSPPAQQQEPPTVAELLCVCGAEWEWRNRDWELVATPPAQRTWVGLTDEELSKFDVDPVEAKLMIAKLKEKNNG